MAVNQFNERTPVKRHGRPFSQADRWQSLYRGIDALAVPTGGQPWPFLRHHPLAIRHGGRTTPQVQPHSAQARHNPGRLPSTVKRLLVAETIPTVVDRSCVVPTYGEDDVSWPK